MVATLFEPRLGSVRSARAPYPSRNATSPGVSLSLHSRTLRAALSLTSRFLLSDADSSSSLSSCPPSTQTPSSLPPGGYSSSERLVRCASPSRSLRTFPLLLLFSLFSSSLLPASSSRSSCGDASVVSSDALFLVPRFPFVAPLCAIKAVQPLGPRVAVAPLRTKASNRPGGFLLPPAENTLRPPVPLRS